MISLFSPLPFPIYQIMEEAPNVSWDDIAGLSHAKKSIQEIVVWPMLRP